MQLLSLFVHLTAVLIRPQDWKDSILTNFPLIFWTASIALLLGLLYWINNDKKIYLPHTTFVLAFLFLVFFSNIVNGNFALGLDRLIYYAKVAAIYFMILFIVDDVKKIHKSIFIFILLVVFIAIQVEYQKRTGINIAGQEILTYDGQRVVWVGMFDGPNGLCILFIVTVAFSLELIFGPYKFFLRIFGFIASLLLLNAIYLTNSRGGLLALLAMLFVYSFFKIKGSYSSRILKALFLFICFSGAIYAFSPSRMSTIDTEESSASEHAWVWEQTLSKFRSNPFFGIGKGNLIARDNTGRPILSHNNVFQSASDMGFAGVFVYIGMMYCCLKGLLITYKSEKDDIYVKSLSLSTVCALIGFIVGTSFITFELDPLFFYWGLSAVLFKVALLKNKNLLPLITSKDLLFIFSIGFIYISFAYFIIVKLQYL